MNVCTFSHDNQHINSKREIFCLSYSLINQCEALMTIDTHTFFFFWGMFWGNVLCVFETNVVLV